MNNSVLATTTTTQFVPQYSDRDYIETCLFIVDKQQRQVPFFYNPVQEYAELHLQDPGINLILKSRKPGISSWVLAKYGVRCLTRENQRAVVISHEKGATERLFAKVQFYCDTLLVGKPALEQESAQQIRFKNTRSTFWIGTAGSRAFGRGDDINLLHISELDWWENPEMLTGVLEACTPGALVIIETTANGFGSAFHKLWQKSKKGNIAYNPIFIPWYMSGDNVLPVQGDMVLTAAEKELQARYKLTSEQINWRRMKLSTMSDANLFQQEHPANDLEAFMASGAMVFPVGVLQDWYNDTREYVTGDLEQKESGEIVFKGNPQGFLRIYTMPEPGVMYRIGADVSEGIVNTDKDTDWSVASVKDGRTWEQVAKLKGRLDPDIFGDYLDILGKFYNTAKLGVEDNAMGIATLTVLTRDKKYPDLYYRKVLNEKDNKDTKKMGWHTDTKSKGQLITLQNEAIRDGLTRIVDRDTIEEHLAFQRKEDGKMSAASGSHDDEVIADAIATMMCHLHPHYDVTTDWTAKQQPVKKSFYQRRG